MIVVLVPGGYGPDVHEGDASINSQDLSPNYRCRFLASQDEIS